NLDTGTFKHSKCDPDCKKTNQQLQTLTRQIVSNPCAQKGTDNQAGCQITKYRPQHGASFMVCSHRADRGDNNCGQRGTYCHMHQHTRIVLELSKNNVQDRYNDQTTAHPEQACGESGNCTNQ